MAQPSAEVEQLVSSIVPWLRGVDAKFISQKTIRSGHALSGATIGSDRSFYVITSGLCASEWWPSPLRRRVLELFCPHDVLQPCSLPVLPGFRIVSVMDADVLHVKPGALEGRAQGGSAVITSLVPELGAAKRRATMLVSSLGGLCAEARVATLFVELSLRLSHQPGDQSGFQMPLSRQDIADHLALNADTLSRILTRFKAEGLFHQIGRDKIYIKNWRALLDQCPVADALLAEYQS